MPYLKFAQFRYLECPYCGDAVESWGYSRREATGDAQKYLTAHVNANHEER